VLVDATFREETQRRAFLELAVRRGVPAVFLLCQAEPETVRRRLHERRADVSDADWPIYVQLAQNWEEVGPSTRRVSQTLAMEGSREQVLSQALAVLRECELLS
jgi:predicted kinase